jgi:hypothetical protein
MKEEFKEYWRVRGYYGLRSDNRPPSVGIKRSRQIAISEREKAGACVECRLCTNLTYSESGICAACESLMVGVDLCVYPDSGRPNSGQTTKGQPHRVAPTKNGVRR